MPYEVTIRCSERRGYPLEKKRCHSDAQARAPVPRGEATASRNAVPAAEQDALRMGWNKVRRPARPHGFARSAQISKRQPE
jgi:hypothetical protein